MKLLVIIDRIISKGFIVQLIFILFIIALVIAVYSLVTHFFLGDLSEGEQIPLPLRIYYMLIDSSYQRQALKGHTNYWHFISIISFSGIVLMSGILISIFANIINRRVDRINNGYMSYSRLHNHILIIGYSRIALEIINYESNDRNPRSSLFREKKTIDHFPMIKNFLSFFQSYKYVIITNQEASLIKNNLKAILPDFVYNRTLVLRMYPNTEKNLKSVSANRCERIYILGDESEPNKDGINIESWNCIRKMYNSEMWSIENRV